MTTASEVVTGALRLIGAYGVDETPSAEDAAAGLVALNQMLAGWGIEGIRLEHAPLALGDTLPYPDDHERPIRFNLAVELAPEYGAAATLSPTVVRTADTGKRMLKAVYTTPPKLRPDIALHPYYHARINGNTY